ncbi:hypothetical protein K504DRAFT_433846 [Pleomassaria siparia CBS 279.74]|uniref:DJ-1/PfpI domain-containing protein n=1 Tax=Pleomassaria siparia CBS 279.74 TaxID=1314801 RepID=A0A6G1K8A7_9PLEO|nr:hypothetical protein K504DRAFT_433846 [Pleomassaria siparia CBS 279.74]
MSSKPTVLFLSLDEKPWFDEMYSPLINALADRATIKRSRSSAQYLTTSPPAAVLVPDVGIITNQDAIATLKTYVANGGTAIFGCTFSSFITPLAMAAFWKDNFNKPWRSGNYTRENVQLDASVAASMKSGDALADTYSQKALFLAGVKKTEVLYGNSSEAAIVWAKYGQGWIGYIGDVNGEKGSDDVIVAMCGL